MLKDRIAHILRCAMTLISPKLNTRVTYKIKFKRKLNFKNPTYFNEKLLVLKLKEYGESDLIRQCADKYAVRAYVQECGCGEILNDLIAVYDRPEEIDFDMLPEAFAIKWNYGCGLNVICSDKSSLDVKATVAKLKKMGKINAWLPYSEVQYRRVPKKIIVEKYLSDGTGKLPLDYKIYCFNGVARCVMLCVGREKGHPKYYFFDKEWNFLRINKDGMAAPADFDLPKPDGIEQAFAYAEKLCRPFAFVRADFYLCAGRVFFGELTFTPCGAMDNGMPESLDRLLGEWLQL